MLLSERQRMGPILPLLWLCKTNGASNLQQFEALLALTNLASVGDQTRNSIAGNKGVPTLQYLQVRSDVFVANRNLCLSSSRDVS
jgi:protein unc-45